MLLYKKLFLVIRHSTQHDASSQLHNRIFDHMSASSLYTIPRVPSYWCYPAGIPSLFPQLLYFHLILGYIKLRCAYGLDPLTIYFYLVPSTPLINLTNLVAHIYQSNQSYFTYS